MIADCTRVSQAGLLAEVLQGQAVHDRAEHAHVVGLGAVHAGLGELGAAEEVAAAHDDGDLGALGDDLGELLGDAADDVGVDADLAAAEGLAGELEQHPVVAVAVGGLEGGGRGQRWGGVGQRVIPRSTSVWVDPAAQHERPRSREGSGAVHRACEPQAWPTSKRANRSTVRPASSTICFTVRLGSVIDGCSSRTKSL